MVVDPDQYRKALRRYTGGVTVVTVNRQGTLHGMTASSFAAVSLDPPLVLVCLEKTSQTRALVLEQKSFAVSVLKQDQSEVAQAFALAGAKPFDRLAYRSGIDGAPLLEGAIAWIECRVENTVEAGDHDVIIGRVEACDVAGGTPLVFFERKYRGITDL